MPLGTFSRAWAIATIISGIAVATVIVDTDGDGVEDILDVCPETPPGTTVDDEGRPLGDTNLDCDFDLNDWSEMLGGLTGPLPPCTKEVCDGSDNDCNGIADDHLTDTESCAFQAGVCAGSQRSCVGGGYQVCTGPEFGSAYESVEVTCDGLDNDCDGQVDEGFFNTQGTGTYDTDTGCGDCFTDCTILFDLPNASGRCETSGPPRCAMVCDTIGSPSGSGLFDFFDLNGVTGDGCEFRLDPDVIYVSTTDPAGDDEADCGLGPVGTGGVNRPCLTINQGITRAVTAGRSQVFVAGGTYDENVTLANGVSVFGRFNVISWARDGSSLCTVVRGPSGTGDRKTVIANGITTSTTFDGFTVLGTPATSTSANSYADLCERLQRQSHDQRQHDLCRKRCGRRLGERRGQRRRWAERGRRS